MIVSEPARAPGIRPAALRAYDIRGVYGRDLDEGDAHRLGLAYATQARAQGLSRIGVGRDGRTSSPALEAALVSGLAAGGMRVTRVGLGPSPMLGFAVRALRLDGGVMVTASHNPSDENGFKLLLGRDRIHGRALEALVAGPATRSTGGSAEDRPMAEPYVDELAAAAAGLGPARVAWDCGNGATGEIVERLTARLPGEHVLLHTAVDGRFPNHHPDPAVEANLADLKAAVREHGCDVGLAFDGDGDRLGAVDEEGEVVWADQLLLLLAEDLLRERPGATIVADVKCSRVLFDGVTALGGQPVMSPSGYVHVLETMRRRDALLGGELSGHIFFADRWDGTDDGVYAALRTLSARQRSGRSMAEFRRSLPRTVATPELRLACPDELKAAVVAGVSARLQAAGLDVDGSDGLRVTTDDGWWLLRGSGTEPKLTCRCEASDEAGLERLKGALRAELAAFSIDAGAL